MEEYMEYFKVISYTKQSACSSWAMTKGEARRHAAQLAQAYPGHQFYVVDENATKNGHPV